MDNKEKKGPQQQPSPAAKPAQIITSAPIAEPRASKLSDQEFGKWFHLFFKAVSHEVGNSINIFRFFSGEKGGEEKETVTKLIDSYTRLAILSSLASGKGYFELDHARALFSPWKLEEIGIIVVHNHPSLEGYTEPNFDGIREAGLAEVMEFRSLLLELGKHFREQAEAHKEGRSLFHLNRAVECGSLLSGYLEGLMIGNIDFTADLMKLEIGDMADAHGSPIAVKWSRTAAEHMLKTNMTCPADAGSMAVVANPFFCTLIFENIASNAERAMETAGAEPEVELSVSPGEDTVSFRFTDRGCGMSKDVMDKLNSGERISTKDEEGEHGLGFNYCAELARQMGGSLRVESSEEGKGTTVVLELRKG